MTESITMFQCTCGAKFSEKLLNIRDIKNCPECGSFERSKWIKWTEENK